MARSRSSGFDKFVRLVTGRKRFTCRRCGWTALRNWHQPPKEADGPKLVKTDRTVELDTAEFDIDNFD